MTALHRRALDLLKKELLRCKQADALSLPALKPERCGLFPGALAILCALFDSLEIENMTFSSGALREGMLYDMIGRNSHEDVRLRTLRAMQERYGVDTGHSNQIETQLETLLTIARQPWKLTPEDEQLVRGAAMVHEIGMTISHHQFHRHGCLYPEQLRYVRLLPRRQQEYMALLVQGHRRSFPVQALLRLEKDSDIVSRLVVLLRLAILLSQRYAGQGPACSCQIAGSRITLSFPEQWLDNNPLTRARCKKEQQILARAGYNLSYPVEDPGLLC